MPSIANQFHGKIILPVSTTGTVVPQTVAEVEAAITAMYIAKGITPVEVKFWNGQ